VSIPTPTNRQPPADALADGALEASVAAAVEACDGDLRATIRALILANAFLEGELMRARALQSRGYVGGAAPSHVTGG
jgi:hypothetical protein